jgi:hypothetical protein
MHEKLLQQLETLGDLGQNSHYTNNKLGFDNDGRIIIEPNTLSRFFKKCDHSTIFKAIEELYADAKIICDYLTRSGDLVNGITGAQGRADLDLLMKYTLKIVKSLSGLDELIKQYNNDVEYVARVKKTRSDVVAALEPLEFVFERKFRDQKIDGVAMSDIFKFLVIKKI